jgi:membrane-bound lytic murein transglycosylase B
MDLLARNARSRLVLAGGVFVVAAAAVAIGLSFEPRPHPAAPAPPVHRAKPMARAIQHKPVPRPKPPAPPSAFALEQTMSDRELMERWTPQIREASRRFNLNAQWIRAVMTIESGGRTMLAQNEPIVSSAGAMGLMQLMPQTWAQMRAAYRLGNDPFDPHDNVMAGTAYLSLLYRQYGYPTMFAAYNDGPGMLAAHAALHQSLPAETESYVRDIASILGTGVRYRAGSVRNQAALTRPDGTTVMIDAGAVVSLRAALPGEYAPGVRTVVAVGRMRQGVKESVEEARAALRRHGGLI